MKRTWAALALPFLLSVPAVGAASAATTASVVHVDCGAPAGGDGSVAQPIGLAAANALVLAPGQSLLLRRGSSCTGTLAPQGSGTTAQPIVIGAYGTGPRPLIDGAGADAVRLQDESNVALEDLELESRGDGTTRARGVHLVAATTLVRNVRVQRLYIHDVDGNLTKDRGGSGGIQVDVDGAAPVRFDRVTLRGNIISNVTRSGIFIVGSGSGSRPRSGQPWPEASTNIVVRGNHLDHLGGDGIVPTGTLGALVDGNVVSDGNLRGTPWYQPNPVCNAGIWTFNANDTVIQRNEVSGMQFNGCDGTGFDVDYDQDGTIVQSNYSHDNAGGFILLCTDPDPRTSEVRFNLSVDDAVTYSDAPCDIQTGGVGTLGDMRFTNNTIVAAQPTGSLETIPQQTMLAPGNLLFANNIVYASTPQTTPLPCGGTCTNNLFFQLPPSGANAITADPHFWIPALRARSRFAGLAFIVLPGSPAIGAGIPVPNDALTDYFGLPVSSTRPLTIGFFQAPWR